MTALQNRTPKPLPASMTLSLLFVGYLGLYYEMVRPVSIMGYNAIPFPVYDAGAADGGGIERSSPWLTAFFAPAHCMDRRIRREVWRVER